MAAISFDEAFDSILRNRAGRAFPTKKDPRFRGGVLFPNLKPKFKFPFQPMTSVFTIGSCFARRIEYKLLQYKVNVPTRRFNAPKEEGAYALLNEYNPGSICQRIVAGMRGESLPIETIVPSGQMFADLLMRGEPRFDVRYERAIERRSHLADVYKALPTSNVVVITLGYVESWYDNETQCYLNRMPLHTFAKNCPGRFEFRRMDVDDAMPLFENAFDLILSNGIRIILTVSPVPLDTTFMSDDCVVANEFSKSVLRVCAERLSRSHSKVDYFPSFEIIRSAGLSSFEDDHIHPRSEIVEQIMAYMESTYNDAYQVGTLGHGLISPQPDA